MIRKILLIALAVFVGSQCINAQKKSKTPDVPDGIFFKIEGKGLKQPSYALGTMHYVHGDYMHHIEGFDSILATIGCLATELKMDYILHPETVEVNPNFRLTRMDSIKLNSMLPDIIAEFQVTDGGGSDVYERTFTPSQIDSLDRAMEYLQVDQLIRGLAQMQGQEVPEGKIYRHASPLELTQLLQALSVTQAAKYFVERGYSQDYQQLDHKVMLTVNDMNENKGADILCVGLDSTYAYRQMQENSTTIKDLVSDLTAEHLARLIYRAAINYHRVGQTFEHCMPLYDQGHGQEVVDAMAAIESKTYSDPQLVDGRNRYWMEQLPALMKANSTLICVGLAHLVPTSGSEGVLSMLKKKGYKITKLK